MVTKNQIQKVSNAQNSPHSLCKSLCYQQDVNQISNQTRHGCIFKVDVFTSNHSMMLTRKSNLKCIDMPAVMSETEYNIDSEKRPTQPNKPGQTSTKNLSVVSHCKSVVYLTDQPTQPASLYCYL